MTDSVSASVPVCTVVYYSFWQALQAHCNSDFIVFLQAETKTLAFVSRVCLCMLISMLIQRRLLTQHRFSHLFLYILLKFCAKGAAKNIAVFYVVVLLLRIQVLWRCTEQNFLWTDHSLDFQVRYARSVVFNMASYIMSKVVEAILYSKTAQCLCHGIGATTEVPLLLQRQETHALYTLVIYCTIFGNYLST